MSSRHVRYHWPELYAHVFDRGLYSRPVPRGGSDRSYDPPPNSAKVHIFRLLILHLFQNFGGQAPSSPGMSSLVHISSQTPPPPSRSELGTGLYTVCLCGTLSCTQFTLESSTRSGMDTWLCQSISIYQYLWLIVRCHCHWPACSETLGFYTRVGDQHFNPERLTALDISPLTLSVSMVDSTEGISDVSANLSFHRDNCSIGVRDVVNTWYGA